MAIITIPPVQTAFFLDQKMQIISTEWSQWFHSVFQVNGLGVNDPVLEGRTIGTQEGLQGGGDLSQDRTISLDVEGLTTDASPDIDADFVATYDTSAAGHKKVLLSVLQNSLGQDLWETITADTGSTTANSTTDTLTVSGGSGIGTAISADTLTISGEAASTSSAGIVELATGAETNAGTSVTLAVTPDSLDDWTGSAQITTLGTISTGVWEGTTIAVDQGGTGQSSYTDGQLLIGNSTGNTLAKATLSEGEGIDISNGSGAITISGEDASDTNKGIASFDATDFSVSSGDVTLSSERIEDIAGGMWTGNTATGVTVTYQDADGTMDIVVADTTVAGDTGSTGITPGDTLTIAGGTNITTSMSGDTLTINNDYTDESIQDLVGNMVTGNTETNITVTYQDADGTLDFTVSDLTVAGDSGSTDMSPGDTLTVAGGTNLTTSMSGDTLTLNVDDAFLANDGDVGTGVYDFGGATSFEIPNGSAPTVDAAGEIAVDTSITDYTGLVKYHDGTEELTVVAMPTGNLTTTDKHAVVYDATNNEFKMEAQSGAGGGSGDWTLISSATASTSASIDFTGLSSTYSYYVLLMTDVVPASDDVTLIFRTSTDNGSSFDAGATDYEDVGRTIYHTGSSVVEDATGGTSGTAIELTGNDATAGVGNASNEQLSGTVTIFDPSATTPTRILASINYTTAGSEPARASIAGARLDTTAVDAIQVLFSSGNISSGNFKLYGVSDV